MSVHEAARRAKQRQTALPKTVQRAKSAVPPKAETPRLKTAGHRPQAARAPPPPELTFLRFADLRLMRLVLNWTTLARLIAKQNFPAGRMVGNARLWTKAEVEQWIADRPTDPRPARGRAKTRQAAKRATTAPAVA